MPFRVERSSADIRDGFYGTVLLLLFEGGANPSMQAPQFTWNGREPSTTASHLGKTKIGGVASSVRISRTNFSIAGVNANLTPFQRSELIGRSLFDKSGKKLQQ